MPLPAAIEKMLNDVDKKLHEDNQVTRVLQQIEEKAKVKRLHLVAGFVALHALYLIFGHSAELLCNLIGFLYPAYVSMKAIESANKDDDTQWLTYWVVFALLCIIEFFSEVFLRYFPFYWLCKCAFLLYLYLPMTMGSRRIYLRLLQPIIRKHHVSIDKRLGQVADKIGDTISATRHELEEHLKPS